MNYEKSDNNLPLFGFIIGIAVGAAVGVLFAPKRGSEARLSVMDKFNSFKKDENEKHASKKIEDQRTLNKEVADHLVKSDHKIDIPAIKVDIPKSRQLPVESTTD